MHIESTTLPKICLSTSPSARLLTHPSVRRVADAPAPAWPAWRREAAALARLARRRVVIAAAFAPVGDRLDVESEIALLNAQLRDLSDVARLRAARRPAGIASSVMESVVDGGGR